MKDPVCGMEVKDGDTLIYRGKKIMFCCATCRWAFEQNPSAYKS